jgi:hypothetical protein
MQATLLAYQTKLGSLLRKDSTEPEDEEGVGMEHATEEQREVSHAAPSLEWKLEQLPNAAPEHHDCMKLKHRSMVSFRHQAQCTIRHQERERERVVPVASGVELQAGDRVR